MAIPAALSALQDANPQPSPQRPALAPPQSLQLAVYDSDGAFYACHLDNPGPDAPGARDGPPGLRVADRAVTAILYLNPAWGPGDGGQLRLWRPSSGNDPGGEGGGGGGGGGGEEGGYLDVEPLGGRLLLFRSADVEHEVRPARARRWALSAWVPWLESCS
ncbi:hypothetical protein MNEG_16311 [Monoraphidium neglectum]|uniref:Fe2OG dioxygenase domain-containing protein n=1 Tax=Monoraphidium neglectum TaxID=145388 RepID=A0A0D2IUS5_9CHLO|nr:hypothetical protein MNEG_16311 [Monoraphidium neglectum]KIY91652.1 hypothetical protein MNEG_16311 [Monoraphidium neglectum]|eukprot:XP_013890672.1 hypothetical protein MNEG_16311 [Monoraphidium neglectum]